MIYEQDFLFRLEELKGKQKVILNILKSLNNLTESKYIILIKNLENKELKKKLKKTKIDLFALYTYNLLYGKGKLFNRLKLFEEIGIQTKEIAELLFWSNPLKFPFPSPCKEYDRKFIKKMEKKLLKKQLENFLELYALETFKKQNFLNDITTEINEITFFNFEKIFWIKDIIKELDPISKEKIKSSSKIHPYLLRAIFSKPECPVILDGNNICYWTSHPNPENILMVFDRLSEGKKFYFPYYIVFDKNAKYIFKNSKVLNFQNVYFHSPADELIIYLSKSKGAKIISKDNFRDWDKEIKKHILKI
ncbi:hypothetical protein SU69_07230 [Thermosipho melanesiensis]|uniref:RNase NYN domain-containing protein n=2 Tax=Thermosipho melanesiensis TaxID=46541 RepID=A6LMX3_THEM4|nr:hypothetical protein [Thermosipho melanesiensis]ABR31274.1 hypothetical protein Tmel_1427 [Thermosipho melanesiensis BI429]APT74355.1 hypothetical protein BW47_07555 [Thermosipho melanesiensis]OOC36297.1 hypothetical protein SU68_07300 [Thermosipho melanesiensis]OOC37115.1 hypothetical protein SU69_07230 [Thermosipho melanesiensis]OOC37867.1 hypothetical protein SU70_07240 [Thermosipho melanesiensis]